MTSLHTDLSRPVAVDTEAMAWSPSPSGTVWRKRVHLSGEAERGRVTSVVRYDPRSDFPVHDHPEGEEILVLEGVFSDEHGDWPAGTYLLNPEGFRHAPRSREGCRLFVKLRQFAGLDREHVAIQTHDLAWTPGPAAGLEVKALYSQSGYPDRMRLERWAVDRPDASVSFYPDGVELFVISGSFVDAQGKHGPGSWIRLPRGAHHAPKVEGDEPCEIYLKEGGFDALEKEPE